MELPELLELSELELLELELSFLLLDKTNFLISSRTIKITIAVITRMTRVLVEGYIFNH